jgi:hypothetical protein
VLPKLLGALESAIKAAQLCSIAYLALSIGPIGPSDRPLPPKGVGRGLVLGLLLPLVSLLSAL